AVYLQAQQREPGNLDVARAIAEVDRVLSTIAALPLRERENLEILREEVRRTSVVGDYAGLRRAAARLFALVPRDPATLAALRRGFVRSITPGGGPRLDLVYVYGEGEYGAEPPELAALSRRPYAGYLLSTTEVTNAQFAEFLNELERPRDEEGHPLLVDEPTTLVEDRRRGWMPQPGLERHPVVDATWYGARAYAAHAGGRLPTADEWVWALRLGQVVGRAQPGANVRGAEGEDVWVSEAAPVGRMASDGLGLYDMAGNVWEWTEDVTGRRDERRVVVGGSFRTSGSE